MKTVKIGILGLGTVGGGVVNVLNNNATEITRRVGCKLAVVGASVRDLDADRSCEVGAIKLTTDPLLLIKDPAIDLILELIGGVTLAKELVLQAIEQGKHVVTANKALIALHGNEIFAQANKRGVMVLFESAVAGGIPIIKVLREGLSGNQIESLAGIINGTTNFILTAMREQQCDFAEALAEAKTLGYAEADPSFDINGTDAGHKLTILASLAFGIPLHFEQVLIEGIDTVSGVDITYAERLGYRIKHLAIAKKTAAGIELRVHPALIPKHHLIANVAGAMNAVAVQSNALGSSLYYGAGAGAEPTASAVVADIIDLLRSDTNAPASRVPPLAFQTEQITALPIVAPAQINSAYYLRLKVINQPGVLAQVTGILATSTIGITNALQIEPAADDTHATIVLTTQTTQEQTLVAAMAQIEALANVVAPVCRIRLEPLE